MRQLNEMALPRSPTVLPPKTLPRLRLRKMSSRPDIEPVAAPPIEPMMASRFIAIAFLTALGDSDQESSVTEPKLTTFPITPIRAAKMASRFMVLPYFRGGCVA